MDCNRQSVKCHIFARYEVDNGFYFGSSELRDAVLSNYELGEDWEEYHLEGLQQIYEQMADNGKKLR